MSTRQKLVIICGIAVAIFGISQMVAQYYELPLALPLKPAVHL